MTIQSHYACEEPPNDTVICRFMQMDKFRDLFASEELYFRRTDLFKNDDPREGLPSDEYIRASRDLREGIVEDELTLISSQAFLRQIARLLTSIVGRYSKARPSTCGADTARTMGLPYFRLLVA